MRVRRPTGRGFFARWRDRHTAPGRGIDAVGLAEFLLAVVIALALIAAAFWLTFRFVRPAPPEEFTISAGAEGGAYRLYAGRYAELLAREGIRVEVRTSSGSLENAARLADAQSGVGVAFVQGGAGTAAGPAELVTLAALYPEPLWVFYRGDRELTLLTELEGARIAIGPDGSGTQAVARALIAESRGGRDPGRMLPLGGTAAAEALKAGRVDAAIFVAGADAVYVQDLLRTREVRLMSFGHAEALSRRLPYLSAVTLPRGVIDIAGDIPPRDVMLVATTAYLVARADFHPALVTVLLEAAHRTHRGGGLFHRAGDYPAVREGDYPLSEDARRYFRAGPPFLQRYLPFWVANLIERLLILLVPLVAVVIPVIRFFPGVFGWRMRARVFRWYRDLRAIEEEAAAVRGPEHVRELLARLDAIDAGVGRTRLPLAYSGHAYDLKLHVDLVRTQLRRAPG